MVNLIATAASGQASERRFTERLVNPIEVRLVIPPLSEVRCARSGEARPPLRGAGQAEGLTERLLPYWSAKPSAMKKHLLFLLLAAALAKGLSAQSLPPKGREETYVMNDKGIIGKMALDTAQRVRLEAVERQYVHDMDALSHNDTITEPAAEAEADRIAAERHQQMKAVLTPEQWAQWARMTADADVD